METFERIKEVSKLSKASQDKVADALFVNGALRKSYKGYAKLVYHLNNDGLKIVSVTPIAGVPDEVEE